MNHKRHRPKARRAGCLLCKPNKLGQGMERKPGHHGFGAHVKRDRIARLEWPGDETEEQIADALERLS